MPNRPQIGSELGISRDVAGLRWGHNRVSSRYEPALR